MPTRLISDGLLPRRAAPYALLAVTALIVAPVFMRGLPCSDDGLSQVSRAIQVDFNLRGGAPFLQWAPDMMRGYGYPVLGFYAPLSIWLMVGLHALGLSFSAAERLLFFLALVGAGWSAYALGRCVLRVPGAFVAGLAYLFAPYLLYDTIQRGALAESLALAWLPLVLAAVYRTAQRPSLPRIVLAAAAFAVLAYLHNLIPLMAVPMIGGISLAATLPRAPIADGRLARLAGPLLSLKPVAAALVLGLTLSAAFWLPALVELRFTLSGRAEAPPPALHDWPRYDQNFVPLRGLVQRPVEPGDPALLNAPVTRALGLGQALGAVVGVAAVCVRRGTRAGRLVAAFTLIGLLSAWVATSSARSAWDMLAVLRVVQLPTRFLGIASLAAAFLAGSGADWLWSLRPGRVWRALALMLPALSVSASGWAWLQPRYCPLAEPVTRADLASALSYSRWMIDPLGELLPATVEALPAYDGLMPQYRAGLPVDRLLLAPGTEVVGWLSRPAHDVYSLELSAPAQLTYQTFYFPGWTARLDGAPLPISVTQPEGLISVPVPAGRHQLAFSFERTPIRWAGLVVSWAAAVFAGAGWLRSYAARRRPATTAAPLEHAPLASLGGVTMAILASYFGLVQLVNNPLQARRLKTDGLTGVEVTTNLGFSGELRHLGYTLGSQPARGGAAFELTQYWRALTDIGVPYGMEVRVVDQDGQVWSLPSRRPFGFADFPGTESWPIDAYARDAYEVRLLAGTPPGTYWLETSVFRRDVMHTLMPDAGVPVGHDPAFARLGALTVPTAQISPSDAPADVTTLAPVVLRPALTLTGWSVPDAPMTSGDLATIHLLWTSAALQPDGAAGNLELLDSAGHTAAELPFSPGGHTFPIEAWPRNAIVRDQLRWRLSPALSSGSYAVRLRLAGATPVTLGAIQLDVPTRRFDPPDVQASLDSAMAFARLYGFSASALTARPGDTLQITLVWQALGETETSYRVFIHLRDAGGAVRTQADGVPVNWTRPTTGWQTNEYLEDGHTLPMPADLEPGEYGLVAGLYDPATGQRLGEAMLATITIR